MLAGSVALSVNVAALLALGWVDTTPPLVAPPAIELSLVQSPLRPRPVRPRPSRSRSSATDRLAPAPNARAAIPTPVAPAASAASGAADPAWRVAGADYGDPVQAERARRVWRAAEKRRLRRACLGLSDEHMTDSEKTACWMAWAGGTRINALPATDR